MMFATSGHLVKTAIPLATRAVVVLLNIELIILLLTYHHLLNDKDCVRAIAVLRVAGIATILACVGVKRLFVPCLVLLVFLVQGLVRRNYPSFILADAVLFGSLMYANAALLPGLRRLLVRSVSLQMLLFSASCLLHFGEVLQLGKGSLFQPGGMCLLYGFLVLPFLLTSPRNMTAVEFGATLVSGVTALAYGIATEQRALLITLAISGAVFAVDNLRPSAPLSRRLFCGLGIALTLSAIALRPSVQRESAETVARFREVLEFGDPSSSHRTRINEFTELIEDLWDKGDLWMGRGFGGGFSPVRTALVPGQAYVIRTGKNGIHVGWGSLILKLGIIMSIAAAGWVLLLMFRGCSFGLWHRAVFLFAFGVFSLTFTLLYEMSVVTCLAFVTGEILYAGELRSTVIRPYAVS